MPPILHPTEKLLADMYLDGFPHPQAIYTPYTIECFHRAHHRGMHGHAEWALWPSLLSFDPIATCQGLASLLYHTYTHQPESSPCPSACKKCSLKILAPKKACFSSEFCLLNPIIDSTHIYQASNTHLLSRKLQSYFQEFHPRDLQFALGVFLAFAPQLHLPG